MTKQKNKHKQSNQDRKSHLRPPYYINKNYQFDLVRKYMAMKTDGPTLDEMSSLDTTGNVGDDQTRRPINERPVSNSIRLKNWAADNCKEIIITIVASIIVLFASDLIVDHGKHLVKHDNEIEVLQKSDDKQDESIEKVKDDLNELKTDVRLIEQRIELSLDKSEDYKTPSKKKVSK